MNYDEYRNSLIGDLNPIDWETFQRKTSLHNTWDRHIAKDEEDVRYKAFSGDKTKFFRFYYEFFVLNIDCFLKKYYEKRIRDTRGIDMDRGIVPIRNNEIENVPNNTRYIRSAFSLSKCQNRVLSSIEVYMTAFVTYIHWVNSPLAFTLPVFSRTTD